MAGKMIFSGFAFINDNTNKLRELAIVHNKEHFYPNITPSGRPTALKSFKFEKNQIRLIKAERFDEKLV